MAENTVKTVWLDSIEIMRSLQIPFSTAQYSTLNEKHGIEADHDLPSGIYPKVQYLAIGNGGHRNVPAGTGASLQDILQHGITDAALFNQIPFVIRRTNDDLTPTQREKYRLRTLITIGNVDYFAYYLRTLTFNSQTPELNVISTDGTTTVTPFVPTSSILNPTPVSMENGQVVESTGKSISVQVPISVELDNNDIAEIMNAVEIIHGDRRYGVISEVGVVSGIDVSVNSSLGNVPTSYTEAIAAQVCNFIGSNINLIASSSRVGFDYDLGTTQPYLF